MTLRSRPWKEHDTVRLKIIAERLQALHSKRRPRRIARWWVDRITGRGRLLTGTADGSRSRGGRRWRLVLRLKRLVATWYRRREL